MNSTRGLRILWIASAWLFVLGALTGAFFRWGMVASFPDGWSAANIRHAHSHIMLMGWATPALMALMAARWPMEGGRAASRAVCVTGWAAWGLALASFPAFLLYGYQSVAVGGATLPIAAILSGLAILAWYGFAAVYWWANRAVERTPAMRLWDLAVAALVISSFGAWAVAGLMIAGVESPLWEAATVHFFVDLFGGGWLVLGVLGMMRSHVTLGESLNEKVGRMLAGSGVGLIFLVGLPRAHTPELWPLIGSAAAGLVAAGLALICVRMWEGLDLWSRRVFVLLSVKIVMLAAVAIPPLADWGLGMGLRLFYLHLALVGVVTLGLAVMAHRQWGARVAGALNGWLVATLALLVSILPLTGLWPSALGGRWVFQVALSGAVIATLAVVVGLVVGRFRGMR